MKKIIAILLFLLIPIMCHANVNEGTEVALDLSPTDLDGKPVVVGYYKIRFDDVTSGANLIPTTTIVPSDTTYRFIIAATYTDIINRTRPYEDKNVHIDAYISGVRVGRWDYTIRFNNLGRPPL